FDELTAEPARFLDKVCAHIGADTAFEWSEAALHKPVNPNPPRPMPQRAFDFRAELYRDEIEQLGRHYGAPVNSWIMPPDEA
ncbi:MAG: hypothetical protein HKO07_05885, partial [Pseudomonadales bacterium]|nr:hypothetical protein [Pseudomonadales bacterium]